MPQAEQGNKVKVHYTGKLEDGTVFDSSQGREPLEFKLGEQQVIPGFEQAIVGMSPGESKTETIASDQAYGPRREEMVMNVPADQLPDDLEPEVGQRLEAKQPDGKSFPVVVTSVGENEVTLDANHPLAGKDLTFEIELVEVE